MSIRKSNITEDVDLSLTGSSVLLIKHSRPNSASKNNFERPVSAIREKSTPFKDSSDNKIKQSRQSPSSTTTSCNNHGLKDGTINMETVARNQKTSSPDERLKVSKSPSSSLKICQMRASPVIMNYSLPNVPAMYETAISTPVSGYFLEAPVSKIISRGDDSSIKSNLSLPPRPSSDCISDIETWNSLQPNSVSSVKSSQSAPNFHSDIGGILNSLRDESPFKTHTLNNVSSLINKGNNHSQQKALRASLGSFANSHQNLTSKTPVNQLRSPHTITRNIAEDYICTVTMAAIKIQRWYRRQMTYRQEADTALRKLLEEKRTQRIAAASKDRRLQEKKLRKKKKKSTNKWIIGDDMAKQTPAQNFCCKKTKRLDSTLKVEPDYGYSAGNKISLNCSSNSISKNPLANTYDLEGHSDHSSQEDTHQVHEEDKPLFPVVCESSVSSLSRDVDEFLEEISGHLTKEKIIGEVETVASSGYRTLSKTTLGDLLETLKRLEEDHELTTSSGTPHTDTGQELDQNFDQSDFTCFPSSEPEKWKYGTRNGLLSENKLSNILDYLDEIEKVDAQVIQETRHHQIISQIKPEMSVVKKQDTDPLERATQTASQIATTIMKQRLELEEKNKIIKALRKTMHDHLEITVKQAKETEDELINKIQQQKNEYEDVIKGHLTFIDQLLKEKEVLNDKCGQLIKQLKTIDQRHKVELQKAREMHVASEKLRRQKWIEEKTKHIKELTIQGLEPEVQRIVNKHKEELQRIKAQHAEELTQAGDKAAQSYIRQLEEAKVQLMKEREENYQREQKLAKERYSVSLRSEEKKYRQQCQRFLIELREERDSLTRDVTSQRKELHNMRWELEEADNKTTETVKAHVFKLKEQHKAEMKGLAVKLNFEKQQWEMEFKQKQELLFQTREQQLKETMKKNQEQEIKIVISKLSDEVATAREEYERAADAKIKFLKNKYENDIKEMDKSQQSTLQSLSELKIKHASYEEEKIQLKATAKVQEQELQELKRELYSFKDERRKLMEIIVQECLDPQKGTENEKGLHEELLELRARYAAELERARKELLELRKTKDAEMEKLHFRIKSAFSKKENTINHLRHQYQFVNQKVEHLQKILEEQREQLLEK